MDIFVIIRVMCSGSCYLDNRMTKLMVKYRPNGCTHLGRPLEGLLDGAETSLLSSVLLQMIMITISI